MQESEIKRFSDFQGIEKPMEGKKIAIMEILNREIVVVGFACRNSKIQSGEDYVKIQFRFVGENDLCVVFTGSRTLQDQLSNKSVEFPFIATIKQIGKSFSFT